MFLVAKKHMLQEEAVLRQKSRVVIGQSNNRGTTKSVPKDTRIPTGNGNSVSIDDLTKFFELVNNPGIRNILKPEIVEALSPQNSGGKSGGRGREKPKQNFQPQEPVQDNR